MPGEKAAGHLYPPSKGAGALNQSGHREDGKQFDELKKFFFCRKSCGRIREKAPETVVSRLLQGTEGSICGRRECCQCLVLARKESESGVEKAEFRDWKVLRGDVSHCLSQSLSLAKPVF